MSTLTLKNVPEKLHQSLKERAKAHQRSLNQEVIATLMDIVEEQSTDQESLLKTAKAVREPIQAYVTQKDLDALVYEGRL